MFIHKLLHREDKSLIMSAPRDYKLYGVTVRKLPVAKYIQVMRTLNDLPALLMGELFPECRTLPELISVLGQFDQEKMTATAVRLLTVVPVEACRVFNRLLDIPEERLLDPDAPDGLGLAELAEILEGFWKLNDLSDFFETVRRLTAKPDAQNIGFNAGLPSDKALV